MSNAEIQTNTSPRPWWRDSVVYEIYIRSFCDGDGDGIGDVAGIRSKLSYLKTLGVDAIWVTPWYLSPQADAGYDVTDYRRIDPLFGSVEQVEKLIGEAHALGLRVIPDIVPKHTSVDHEWFRAALRGKPGGPERARYCFRPGRGADGELPPNNWISAFGGPAWTRIEEADGTPGEWYCHLHASSQPELNWRNPEVRAEFEAVLRFWFDRGVDGFRIDVARGLDKHPDLPDMPDGEVPDGEHPYYDREGGHEVYRTWRRIAEAYDGDRAFIGEVWCPPHRLARYLRPGELHTAFNFDFLWSAWDASALHDVIESTLSELSAFGAPATWVLSNHDFYRHPSRYGRPVQQWNGRPGFAGFGELDLDLGIRRARAAALLLLSLPGSVYIYQGEELGLAEVEDLPEEALQDPTWEQSGHERRGRDGCRVPMPWSRTRPPFGFTREGVEPWLPQPKHWAALTAEAEDGDPESMLTLYRTALRLRRELKGLRTEDFRWIDCGPDTLAYARGASFLCVVNVSDKAVRLPHHREVLLTSGLAIDDGELPGNTAVWLQA